MSEKTFEGALDDLEAGPAPASAEPARGGEEGDANAHPAVGALRERFGDAILAHTVMAGDEHVVHVRAERNVEILQFLRDDPAQQYDYLADLTAVDWGGDRPIEVVYQLWSIANRRALRVKAALPVDELEIDSVAALWKTANWLERETWDMFGIRFRGHPDHRRILMPDSYAEGFPLRKGFPLRGRFSRAEQTRRALAMTVDEHYSAGELAIVEEVKRDTSPPDSGDRSAGS
jgi:NADH-quinone oxidoreductase subunit C